MTQYLLSVHGSDEDMQSIEPAALEQVYKDVDELNERLKAEGAWVFAGGLHPSDTATVVSVRDGETLITDGPFAETKEQIGGFWIIEASDLDAALAWGEQATRACQAPVEVRPFQEEPQG